QAEDGIRDRTVTGVQTCALPILWEERAAKAAHLDASGGCLLQPFDHGCSSEGPVGREQAQQNTSQRNNPRQPPTNIFALSFSPRSEERRVGKECRSRWGTD